MQGIPESCGGFGYQSNFQPADVRICSGLTSGQTRIPHAWHEYYSMFNVIHWTAHAYPYKVIWSNVDMTTTSTLHLGHPLHPTCPGLIEKEEGTRNNYPKSSRLINRWEGPWLRRHIMLLLDAPPFSRFLFGLEKARPRG